ncbi:hypothetical protein AURDEDRAFT_164567 [Auricularia subglabra TFB-10046 SS5]|nr:hypothetical protein AURDEDRAFT_164567 [Auricularia subglabra TFB-10046 SS5]
MWARPPPPPSSTVQRHYAAYPPPPPDARGPVRPNAYDPARAAHGPPPPPQYYHPGTHRQLYYPSYPFAGPGQWAPPPQALVAAQPTVPRKRPAPPNDDNARPPPALRPPGYDSPMPYMPAYHYPMASRTPDAGSRTK